MDYAPFGRPVPVATLNADRIGPYAMRGATAAPEIDAEFDWFRWSPTADELEACTPVELVVSDLVAPAVPDGDGGWYRGPVTVALSAEGGSTPTIEYNLGDGWTEYAGPITIADDGVHELAYRATDGEVTSEPGLVQFSIDSTLPVVSAEPRGRTLELTASDGGSGLDLVEYRLGDGAWVEFTEPIDVGSNAVTVQFRATDVAGNQVGGDYSFAAAPGGTSGNLASTGAALGSAMLWIGLGLLLPGSAIAVGMAVRHSRRGEAAIE